MKKIPLTSRIIVPVTILLIGIFFCLASSIAFLFMAIDYSMGHEGRVPVLKLRLKRILYYFRLIKIEKSIQKE